MKILIVSGFFPPYAPVSGSRINKLSKYLEQSGHEIKVLAPLREDQDRSLKPEISDDKVIFTSFTDINSFPSVVKRKIKNLFASDNKINEDTSQDDVDKDNIVEPDQKESQLSYLYRRLTNIPDRTIGWYPTAVKEAHKLFGQWTPDVIFTSVPPFTTLLIASKLARMIDVPWIADYRDLWSDHGYYEGSKAREKVDRFLENRALSNCSGLITVTNSWAKHLKKSRNIPVEFAMNGFDPDDFNSNNVKILYPDHLTILYAGALYGNKRDPSKLFDALGMLGQKAKDIKVLLYTEEGYNSLDQRQKALIKKHNLQDQVICHEYISQEELLNIQLGVDILLLLRWDDPREENVIAGKLFEYIGADKPILSVGSVKGEAADIIRDNNFGIVTNDVKEIAAYLTSALEEKTKRKQTSRTHPNRDKFMRASQFEKIERFMNSIVYK